MYCTASCCVLSPLSEEERQILLTQAHMHTIAPSAACHSQSRSPSSAHVLISSAQIRVNTPRRTQR